MSNTEGGHWLQPPCSREPPLALSRLRWFCQPCSVRTGIGAAWVPHDALGSTEWHRAVKSIFLRRCRAHPGCRCQPAPLQFPKPGFINEARKVGVGLAGVFWQPHLKDEGQLRSYDAARESARQEVSEAMRYLCGGCSKLFPLVPTAGRGEVPRPRRKECKLPEVSSCEPLNPLVCIFYCIRYLLVQKRGSSGAGEARSPQDALLFGALCCLLLAGLAMEMPQTHVQGFWDAVSTPSLYVPDYFSVFLIISLGLLSSVRGCFSGSDKGSASEGAGDKSTRENELHQLFSPWKHDWHSAVRPSKSNYICRQKCV